MLLDYLTSKNQEMELPTAVKPGNCKAGNNFYYTSYLTGQSKSSNYFTQGINQLFSQTIRQSEQDMNSLVNLNETLPPKQTNQSHGNNE